MPKQFVSTKELAKQTKTDESTIKYYSDEGLIPYFIKSGDIKSRSEKRYPLFDSRLALRRIKRLKNDGYNIAMIKEVFKYDPLGRGKEKNKLEMLIIEKTKKYLPDLNIEFIRCVARESMFTHYWNGKEVPKDVAFDCHIKTNEGNAQFTDFVDKNTEAGHFIWGVLYQIGGRLGFGVFHPKYTHIWDEDVRRELAEIKNGVWDLINQK